jgi:hypothetical protein
MANYRKSFNLRNGVQVDDDNFIVNANGLVGIGTSIPTEFLDVRGNAKVVGLVTASSVSTPNLQVTGVATISSFTDGTVIISSGIVTASSGIVTYYGDGQGLTNIPTSQWVDVNTGTGYSSIYAAGTVGIATTMPNYFLQVGGNPDIANGVGINSTGDIKVTGIVTASSFVGSGIGVTQINASNISSGTLSNSRLPSNISVGIVTATTRFFGNLTGDVTGTASTAQSLTGSPNIVVTNITATNSNVTGISTISTIMHVGSGGTAFAALESGRIGVGTALPTSEVQIRKSSGTLVEVISDSGQSRISIGQSVGVGNSTGLIRFGNLARSLDIINNDTGDFRNILHAGGVGINTGNFKWIYGQTNSEKMTLTWDGKLGINNSSPSNTLDVVGTSTITGNAWIGGDLSVGGNITGTINYPSIISGTNLNNTSGITTLSQLKVTNNVDFTSSTFVGLGSFVGVSTTLPYLSYGFTVKNGIYANQITVQDGLNVSSGYVTSFSCRSTNGFSSGVGTEFVLIEYASSPNRIVFTIPGIGSTSLRLY